MKKLSILCFMMTLLIASVNLSAQEENSFKKLSKEAVEKLQKRFSKRAFIKNIEEQKGDYQEMVSRLKRYEDKNDNQPFKNDAELIAAYNKTRDAYNGVLDLMITDINETKNIAQFHLFDANTRYKHQLEEAKSLGDKFLALGDKKMSGDTKFSPKIVDWFFRLLPILKRVEDIYLDHVKSILTKKLNAAKLQDWGDIS